MPKLKPLIGFGGSPRASINLALAAKAYAFLNKRGYVIPEDVRNVCKDILRHRIGLTYEAEAENVNVEDIIEEIVKTPHPLDQVVKLVESKIDAGMYVRDDPLTSLILRSGASSLFADGFGWGGVLLVIGMGVALAVVSGRGILARMRDRATERKASENSARARDDERSGTPAAG